MGTKRPHALLEMINGYQVSQAIHVAAVLGVADVLRDGPRTAVEIAHQTGADPATVYRLLRALAAVGVFREEAKQTFSQTSISEELLTDSPISLRDVAILTGQESYWNAWGNLLLGVRSGKNVFQQVYGMNVWEYRAQRPELSALFGRAIAAEKSGGSVLEIYDFSSFGVIVDVGGGNGSLLADVLAAHPSAKGIMFDRPHVASNEQHALAAVADRCEIVGGDFFDAVPEGGDVYVLRAILHDWDDHDASAILKTCRRAMPDSAKLLLIERLIGPPNQDAHTKFFDLTMLVNPGGRERTRDEYSGLLNAAGFQITWVGGPGHDQFWVIEAAIRR